VSHVRGQGVDEKLLRALTAEPTAGVGVCLSVAAKTLRAASTSTWDFALSRVPLYQTEREAYRSGSQAEVNSGGFAMPSTVHMARPEVACVLHTHSVAGCAVSMQRDGLLPLNQHALQVIGDIAYHNYEGTGRNPAERARLLADLGDHHILVLRNHGLLIVGTSIAGAFVTTYRMERACAMQLAFQQSGAAFHPITEEVVTAAYNRPTGGRNEPAKFEWPALLRKLDRMDPSYKQ
jgi:ribulose-5-phosphate 4-epimerase/fuculose-1-phosphate aldolase